MIPVIQIIVKGSEIYISYELKMRMLKLKHKIAKQTNTSIFKLGNIP